jgi:phage tail-like protein
VAVTIEQLLATLSLDRAEALAVTDRYVLIMRDPQVDEEGIPIDSTVRLRIVDLSGNPADPDATIDATIGIDQGAGEVTGWNGTAFAAPWNAALSAEVKSTALDPYCYKDYTIDQAPATFASEQLVTVHVNLNTSTGGWGYALWGHFPWGHIAGGVSSVDIYYDFTADDVEPPSVIAAEAIDQFTVRVTFDDDMATSGAGSVLDATAWSFTRLNEDPYPAVTLDAVAVAQVSGTVFDVTTQWEMTPAQLYQVTVDPAATDTSGNAIATASATFAGFQPEHPAGRAWDYWRMLPLKNRIEDATHDLERFARCIDEVLQLLTLQVDHWTDQFDPDLATDAEIDLLLYDLGNPFDWADLDLTAAERRKLLRVLVEIYRSKGTAQGIEDTVFFLLGEVVEVVEFLAGGWVLGVDELGEGAIAQIFSDNAQTFNFAALPADLDLLIDGAVVTVTFEAGDFATPAAATAAEVVAALNAKLTAGGAYVDALGTRARLACTNTETYALSGAETLLVDVSGTPLVVTFHAADFATPGAATAAEVAARITADLTGHAFAEEASGAVAIETLLHGLGESVEVTGGTANAVLGFPAGAVSGTDNPRVAIYSPTVGVDAAIVATGGAAKAVLGFTDDPASGTGGAILAPSLQYALYCFDLETQYQLDSATETIVRRIAEYMKPAHTHLVNIRTALPLPWPEGWEIGVDELGETTELTA